MQSSVPVKLSYDYNSDDEFTTIDDIIPSLAPKNLSGVDKDNSPLEKRKIDATKAASAGSTAILQKEVIEKKPRKVVYPDPMNLLSQYGPSGSSWSPAVGAATGARPTATAAPGQSLLLSPAVGAATGATPTAPPGPGQSLLLSPAATPSLGQSSAPAETPAPAPALSLLLSPAARAPPPAPAARAAPAARKSLAASKPGWGFRMSRVNVKEGIGGKSLAAGAAAEHKGLTIDIDSPSILDQIATQLDSIDIGQYMHPFKSNLIDKMSVIFKFTSIQNRLNSFLIKIHSVQIYILPEEKGAAEEKRAADEKGAIKLIEEDIKITQEIIKGLIDGDIPKDETQTPITNESIIAFLNKNLAPPHHGDDEIKRILSYDTEDAICMLFYGKPCVYIFTLPPREDID